MYTCTPKNENGMDRLSSMEILSRAPKSPNTGLTQIFYKCNNDICKAVGFPNLQGYCGDCYVRLVRLGQIELPQPIIEQRQFEVPLYEDIEESKILNNGKDPQNVDYERQPFGLRSDADFETKFSYHHQRENEKKSTNRTVSFTTSNVGLDELPTRHHQQKEPMRERNGPDVMRCSMSSCENVVCSENENLCASCFEVLKTHKSMPISKRQQRGTHIHTSTHRHTPTKTHIKDFILTHCLTKGLVQNALKEK